MNKPRTTQETDLQQKLQKAERLFARHNYPLAKQTFEAALRLSPDEALSEKIKQCEQQILLAKRKETIKRARRLEKQGKYGEALSLFEKAADQQAEPWLTSKITELRQKQAHAEASGHLSDIDAKNDPEAKLAAYDALLAVNPSTELIEKKAACLVTLGRFEEAVGLYSKQTLANDRARYHYGYACARTGAYLAALEQWGTIEHKSNALLAQIEAMLPFLCRELESKNGGWVTAYQLFQTLYGPEQPECFAGYAHYLKFGAIEELWRMEAFADIIEFIEPHPENLSLPLLDLCAKVYFKLAEEDVHYLEPAISYWLTAIYNDRLLAALTIKQQQGEALAIGAIREKLLRRLDDLIERHARAGAVSNRTRAFRDVEIRVIRRLSMLPADEFAGSLFPCTPTIAFEYGLCQPILAFLEKQRNAATAQSEELFETAAYFSVAGPSLMMIESGEEGQALASIPKQSNDDLLNYCRQRVYLACALKKAEQGEKQLKKYFQEALPLIKRYRRHQEEIIKLAYQDALPSHIGLADAMERLSSAIDSAEFREATAYAMAMKARELLFQNINPAPIEKGLKKALSIDPDSEAVKNTLTDIALRKGFDALDKAFKKQKTVAAAEIVQRNGDPRLAETFFNTMERWYLTVQAWEHQERLNSLREFYQGCYLVDRQHPLTIRIAKDLKEQQR